MRLFRNKKTRQGRVENGWYKSPRRTPVRGEALFNELDPQSREYARKNLLVQRDGRVAGQNQVIFRTPKIGETMILHSHEVKMPLPSLGDLQQMVKLLSNTPHNNIRTGVIKVRHNGKEVGRTFFRISKDHAAQILEVITTKTQSGASATLSERQKVLRETILDYHQHYTEFNRAINSGNRGEIKRLFTICMTDLENMGIGRTPSREGHIRFAPTRGYTLKEGTYTRETLLGRILNPLRK